MIRPPHSRSLLPSSLLKWIKTTLYHQQLVFFYCNAILFFQVLEETAFFGLHLLPTPPRSFARLPSAQCLSVACPRSLQSLYVVEVGCTLWFFFYSGNWPHSSLPRVFIQMVLKRRTIKTIQRAFQSESFNFWPSFFCSNRLFLQVLFSATPSTAVPVFSLLHHVVFPDIRRSLVPVISLSPFSRTTGIKALSVCPLCCSVFPGLELCDLPSRPRWIEFSNELFFRDQKLPSPRAVLSATCEAYAA